MHLFCLSLCWFFRWLGKGRGIRFCRFTDAAVSQAAQRVQAERRWERRWFNGDYPSWKRACAVNKMSGLAGAYCPSSGGDNVTPAWRSDQNTQWPEQGWAAAAGVCAGGWGGSLRTCTIAQCQQNLIGKCKGWTDKCWCRSRLPRCTAAFLALFSCRLECHALCC